jgi:hypothetical protein
MRLRVPWLEIVAAALLLGGCSGQTSHVAEEPLAAIRARLIALPSEANAMNTALQAVGTSYWLASTENPLVWRFAKDGAIYCVFNAKLEEAGTTRTRILSWVENADEAAQAAVPAGRQRADYRFLCDVARIAGEESVRAVIENRPANNEVITAKLRQNLVQDPASAMRAADAAMEAAAPKWWTRVTKI